jgi:hypothetical protein
MRCQQLVFSVGLGGSYGAGAFFLLIFYNLDAPNGAHQRIISI